MPPEQGRGSPPGKLTDPERELFRAHWREIAEAAGVRGIAPGASGGWRKARCPKHDDKTPSFSIKDDGGWNCHSCNGSGGDVVSLVEWAHGCDFPQARDLCRSLAGATPPRRPGPPPSAGAKTKNNGALVSPVPDDAPILPTQSAEAARYAYRDDAGRLLLYVVRTERGDRKDCIPWTLRRFPTGTTVWRPTLQGIGRRTLYGTEALTDPTRPVLFVEGEKTADAARELWGDELAVVTTIGGDGQATQDHTLEALRDRTVTFWPDHDEKGEAYAHALARRVLEAGAAGVAIVDVPPELPAKWDLADLDLPPGHPKHADGFTAEKARALIAAARTLPPPTAGMLVAGWDDRDADGALWESYEPIPADPAEGLPDLDLTLFPRVVRDFARDIAEAPKADAAMAAVAALVGVGAAAALKCCLRTKLSRKPVFSNLSALIVADVAEGKSSAINPVYAATSSALRLARDDIFLALRRYEAEKERLEEKVTEARGKYRKNSDPLVSYGDDLDAAEAALEALTPVFAPSYVQGDPSPEKLAAVMSENAGRVFVCDAEPAFLANLLGRYDAKSKSGDPLQKIESLLKALTNEPVLIGRKDRDVSMDLTAASMAIGLHPSVLAACRSGGQMEQRGFFSRQLFVNAKSYAATRLFDDTADSSGEAYDAFRTVIENLTRIPLPDKLPMFPPVVPLEPDAVAALRNFHDATVSQVAPGAPLEDIKGWATRAPETVQRLALAMHCAKHPTEFLQLPMSKRTMTAACEAMTGYFLPHALYAHRGGVTGDLEAAGKLAHQWARRAREDNAGRVYTLTEIRGLSDHYGRMPGGDLHALLATLKERGIVHELAKGATSAAGGRPSERWELHPRFGDAGGEL